MARSGYMNMPQQALRAALMILGTMVAVEGAELPHMPETMPHEIKPVWLPVTEIFWWEFILVPGAAYSLYKLFMHLGNLEKNEHQAAKDKNRADFVRRKHEELMKHKTGLVKATVTITEMAKADKAKVAAQLVTTQSSSSSADSQTGHRKNKKYKAVVTVDPTIRVGEKTKTYHVKESRKDRRWVKKEDNAVATVATAQSPLLIVVTPPKPILNVSDAATTPLVSNVSDTATTQPVSTTDQPARVFANYAVAGFTLFSNFGSLPVPAERPKSASYFAAPTRSPLRKLRLRAAGPMQIIDEGRDYMDAVYEANNPFITRLLK